MGFGPRLSRSPVRLSFLTLLPMLCLVAACAGGPRPSFTFSVGPQATQGPTQAATAAPSASTAPPASASASAAPSSAPASAGSGASPGASASASATASPSASPSTVPSASPSVSPSASPTPPPSPTSSPSPTPAPTATPLPGASGFIPGSPASPRRIAITVADDHTFAPNVVTLAQGETVEFTVRSIGVKDHTFTIGSTADVFAVPTKATATAVVGKDATVTVPFTVNGPGPFVFASTAEGDLAAGQVGYVVVVGPDVPTVGTEAAPRLVPLVGTSTGLDQPELSIARGETITFLVSNAGAEAREFIVGPREAALAAKIDQITTVTTGPIPSGQVKPLTYTFPAAGGEFAYATHLAGAAQVEPPGNITFR